MNGVVTTASSIPDAGFAERARVLLADDHPAMLALTAEVLSGECLVVGSVGDGCELLAEAERLHPDVIVLDITMPRLDGIEAAASFTLGRCLERTDVVARQLATVAFDEVFDSGLVMLLRSCGGYEPYLRLSQGVVEPGRVLDFLLRDRLFPRSAFASLTLAEECLDQINAGREGAWDDARGLVGLARAELEYSAPATLSRDLETRLERLQASISSVSDAVTRRYFAQDLPMQWRQGGGGG